MIDPDNIILVKRNDNTNIIKQDLPSCRDMMIWDLDDPKEIKRYFKAIESQIRKSFEYREMISFIKTYYDMNQCAYIKCDPNDQFAIRIEVHHYPFTLYDIVEIVYRKRIFYKEVLYTAIAAKEVTLLHYRLLVGLIPLSKTVHQLVHAGRLFIPSYNVLGRYQEFIRVYKDFCTTEQLDTIDRIEKYSLEYSDLQNTTILDTNYIHVQVQDPSYQLPKLEVIEDDMATRIQDIKKNNYRLPTLDDYEEMGKNDNKEDRRCAIDPFVYL